MHLFLTHTQTNKHTRLFASAQQTEALKVELFYLVRASNVN